MADFEFPAVFGSRGLTRFIDLYDGNSTPNFTSLSLEGIKGVYFKLSEGISISEPLASGRMLEARKAGMPIGVYHVLNPEHSASEQAAWFFAQLARLDHSITLELPPVLDWETKLTKPLDLDRDPEVACEFIERVEKVLKCRTVVYLSLSMPEALGNPGWLLNKQWLWVAEYGVLTPQLFKTRILPENVFAWQMSDQGIDLDVFNGSAEDLQTCIAASRILV